MSINKAFKEQFESNLQNSFNGATRIPVIKVLKKGTLVFFHFWCFMKTEGTWYLRFWVYCITDRYVCVDYKCCTKTKINVTSKEKVFENRTYNDVSGTGTTELLMNIILCHGFVNNKNSAVLLSCGSKLIDYYLQICFVLHENIPNDFKNVPLRAKQRINSEHLYKNDFVMACYSTIPSAANTSKRITICSCL